MRKYSLISLLLTSALFLSLIQVSAAADTQGAEKFTLGGPVSAVFYLHDTRPPVSPDGPITMDRNDFDAVFRRNSRFVGYTSDDVDVYVDAKTGCFYKESDHETLYHLDLLGGGTDSYYGFTPTLHWNSGGKTEGVPFLYDPSVYGKCADLKARTRWFKNKLTLTGYVEGSKSNVYEPKDPLNSTELKKLYQNAVFAGTEKPSFQEYVKVHPLIYVYDNLGSFHRLLNSQFSPAAEMGKPALYLYPEKETDYTVKVLPVGGKITAQMPVLKDLTWKAKAKPSGELKVGETSYPYLYYESTTNQPMPLRKGVVVPQKDVPTALSKMLDKIGFKTNEKSAFLEYWLPRMIGKPYYAIQFLMNEEVDTYSKLSIQPKLSVYRVFMNFQGLSRPVRLPMQELPTLDRSAQHAFEWGGNNLAK